MFTARWHVACCVAALAACLAGQLTYGADLLGSPPPAAQGVALQAWFPDHALHHFPVGEPVDVIVGVSNGGAEAYDVTDMVGSLHHAMHWNLWVQNFTAARTHAQVKPGEQINLQYNFRPDANLQTREFQLAIHVFYKDAKGLLHHSVAFNRTVDIIELPKWVDFQLLGLFAMFAAALAGLGYLAYSWVQSKGYLRQTTKRRPSVRPPLSTAGSAEPSQWLKGTYYDTHARAQAKGAARVNKKAS